MNLRKGKHRDNISTSKWCYGEGNDNTAGNADTNRVTAYHPGHFALGAVSNLIPAFRPIRKTTPTGSGSRFTMWYRVRMPEYATWWCEASETRGSLVPFKTGRNCTESLYL